jgi:hypothetical protein
MNENNENTHQVLLKILVTLQLQTSYNLLKYFCSHTIRAIEGKGRGK